MPDDARSLGLVTAFARAMHEIEHGAGPSHEDVERIAAGILALVPKSAPEGDWLTAEELRADPILCEECGEPAEFHGVDGWLCGECADGRDPRYEG